MINNGIKLKGVCWSTWVPSCKCFDLFRDVVETDQAKSGWFSRTFWRKDTWHMAVTLPSLVRIQAFMWHLAIPKIQDVLPKPKKETHPLECFATCLLEHVMTTRTSSSLHPVDLGTRGITLGQAQHRRVVEGTAGWSDRWRWGWMRNNVWMANSLFHLISEPLIGSSFCTQTIFPCCFRPFPDWWKLELICSWDLCLLFRSRKCIPPRPPVEPWLLSQLHMSRWSKRLRSWRFCYVVDKSWAEFPWFLFSAISWKIYWPSLFIRVCFGAVNVQTCDTDHMGTGAVGCGGWHTNIWTTLAAAEYGSEDHISSCKSGMTQALELLLSFRTLGMVMVGKLKALGCNVMF